MGKTPKHIIDARIAIGSLCGGYGDWFLLAKDELNELYQNLKLNGFGGFGSGIYCSSTEWVNSSLNA